MNKKGLGQQEQRRTMMLNDPISRVIPKMAIPTIVAFLINSIYSLADTYFVSSLGTNATAAVSVNASLDQLILMCGSMLAVGANSYIARLLGEGNEKKASQVLSTAFFTAFGIGAAVFSEDGKDFESLFRNADKAVYVVKKRGKNDVIFYGDVKDEAETQLIDYKGREE